MNPEVDPLWQQQARQWGHVRPPLKPSDQDLQRAQFAVDEMDPSRALVLGVTPELLRLRWPVATRLLAGDCSGPMIRACVAGLSGRHWAIQADWLQLPLADASIDVVLGDGCFVLLDVHQQRSLAASIHRVLRPGGWCNLRVFTRPAAAETTQQVWDALLAGEIGSFHVFKFRLLASLADERGHVPVARAWEEVHCRFDRVEVLADQTGWPLLEVLTINAYRGQPVVYRFPTVEQFRAVVRPWFDEVRCDHPSYEMGDRCPTFLLRPAEDRA